MLIIDDLEPPPNDSGQPDAVLPPELRGFSWGGFWGSWVWAAFNGVWPGLLGLVPCVGFLMRFVLGFNGKEWAWRSKKWSSVEEFRRMQKVQILPGICLSLFGWLIGAAFIYPIFGRIGDSERHLSCPSNLKQIALAINQYTQDYNGKCPPGATVQSWRVALFPYLKTDRVFKCSSERNQIASYSVNPKMAGANLDKIYNSSLVPVIFDTEPRHIGGRFVAFADGHVKWYKASVWGSRIQPRIHNFVPDKHPNKE